ncbi:MAG: ElyC/SanA/YdcF family protein [Pseudomonadota bacterium]
MASLATLATALAAPLTLAAFVGIGGLCCRLLGRPRLAKITLSVACAIAWLAATAPVAEMLIAPLEARYVPAPPGGALPVVGTLVVLGSAYRPRADIPITAALDEDGLVRITEALRLARRLDRPRLILSGGAPSGRIAAARGYLLFAKEFGFPDGSMVVLERPLDTAEEATAVAEVLGREPFLLVTSAYHMPRALFLMRRAGLNPIAAPTGQRAGSGPHGWRGLLPTSANLRGSERALHEYLALAALRLGLE